MAVLSFILSSAAKHSVDGESLSSELQQLGLPKGTGTWAGQSVGQELQGCRLGRETHGDALSSPWAMKLRPAPAPTCYLRGPPFYPQSMRLVCVAVMRRSKTPCRSTCGPAACVVSVERTQVGSGLHSRRCM